MRVVLLPIRTVLHRTIVQGNDVFQYGSQLEDGSILYQEEAFKLGSEIIVSSLQRELRFRQIDCQYRPELDLGVELQTCGVAFASAIRDHDWGRDIQGILCVSLMSFVYTKTTMTSVVCRLKGFLFDPGGMQIGNGSGFGSSFNVSQEPNLADIARDFQIPGDTASRILVSALFTPMLIQSVAGLRKGMSGQYM